MKTYHKKLLEAKLLCVWLETALFGPQLLLRGVGGSKTWAMMLVCKSTNENYFFLPVVYHLAFNPRLHTLSTEPMPAQKYSRMLRHDRAANRIHEKCNTSTSAVHLATGKI